MAQQVQVVLIDDFEGGAAAETVTFGLDGVTYEIDLNAQNAAKLREALAVYVGNARKVTGRGARSSTSGSRVGRRRSSANETAAMREWGKKNGHKVSERGRISASLREAYAAAH